MCGFAKRSVENESPSMNKSAEKFIHAALPKAINFKAFQYRNNARNADEIACAMPRKMKSGNPV